MAGQSGKENRPLTLTNYGGSMYMYMYMDPPENDSGTFLVGAGGRCKRAYLWPLLFFIGSCAGSHPSGQV